MPTEDAEPVDTTDAEDADLLLADPKDYHEAQRLREIHEARRHVHEELRNAKEIYPVRVAIAAYGLELEPLIQQLDDFDTSLPDPLPWDDISTFVTTFGHADTSRGEENPVQYYIIVFQRLNEVLAEIKPLIQEDETTEWEV